mgnify:CR=1 FL=1
MKKATTFLIIAYLIGQGSAFSVQLTSKFLGNSEITGLIVILISLFSFSYQFSDMGNSIYVVRKLALKEFGSVNRFLFI